MTFSDLAPELERAGVDYTVLVQSSDNDEDTALMRDTASQHPEVLGIVGYAPLDRPADFAASLGAWQHNPAMVGVRNLTHLKTDPDWLLQRAVGESLDILSSRGLTLDVVATLPRHLEIVDILAERHPDLAIVIDHLGTPPVGGEIREPWWQLIARAASHPSVYAKVSGLYSTVGAPADWTTEAIRPYFDRAVEVFGPHRLMYGGDWPISVLAGGYSRVWNGLQPLIRSLDGDDVAHVLGRTAADFYGLRVPRCGSDGVLVQDVGDTDGGGDADARHPQR